MSPVTVLAARPMRQALHRIGAIAVRDLRVFWSYRLQMYMTVASSMLMVVGLFFMGRMVGQAPTLGEFTGHYFEFALIGVVFISFVNVGLGAFKKTFTTEQTIGTLEVLLTSPTRLSTLLAGMFVFPLLRSALFMAIYVLTAVVLLGASFELAGALPALVLVALTVLVFCAVGAISGAIIVLTKRGDPVGSLATQGATLLGGALFPVAVLPGWLEGLARLLPPYYALEGVRSALINGAGFGAVADEMLILAGFAVVLVPVSLWIFARALRRARILGTLGNY